MTNVAAWELVHSVETVVSPECAWTFMSNVANWDDPPATFSLRGPFVAGSTGTTLVPGQEPRHWIIRAVTPGNSYTVEMTLDQAVLTFVWHFDALASGGGTRITQRISLSGANAADYVDHVRPVFESTLAPGMNRIVTLMQQHPEALMQQHPAASGN